MKAEKMKDLIWSLSWYPFSAYHCNNVKEILKQNFPNEDFNQVLMEFAEVYRSKPGPGSPK